MRLREEEQNDLTLLREEVHRLEQRVEALEHGHEAIPHPVSAGSDAALADGAGTRMGMDFSGATVIAGRAILALAGAYLLRALTESDIAPRLAVITVAVVYGAVWLILAGLGRGMSPVAVGAYGITSAVIVAPLMWEGSVRFGVLTPGVTAAILTGFAGLAFLLSRRSEAAPAFRSVALPAIVLASVFSALVLSVRTGDLIPFTVALLAIAFLTEADWSPERGWSLRVVTSLIANLSVCLVIYIASRPGGTPEGYRALGSGICVALFSALFATYTAFLARNIVWRGGDLSVFEMMQFAICLVISAAGILEVTAGRAAPMLGACCAVLCALCYFTGFGYLKNGPRRTRYFLSAWAVTFGLVSCFLILPDSLLTPTWGLAAAMAVLTGTRAGMPALRLHGNLYLVAAALVSGGAQESAGLILIAAFACYWAFGAAEPELRVVPAALGAFALWRLLASVPAPLSLAATVRTLLLCVISLLLAYTGSRRGRRELVWISYAAIALGTVKLVLEDFQQSKAAALAVSLVCYGAMLILAPRLSRARVKM